MDKWYVELTRWLMSMKKAHHPLQRERCALNCVHQIEKNLFLLYQDRASIRIVTTEGKGIYIAPFAGSRYDLSADLILATHSHFDHCTFDTLGERRKSA